MERPMDDDFYRIRRLPPYVFAEVNAMKAAARARGEDVIDLGMGNPDGAPPKHVIDKLAEVADEIYCANVRGGYSFAVANAYDEWRDISDEEVAEILERERSIT